MVEWVNNVGYLGQTLLIFLLWISSWSMLELTTDKFISTYGYKMLCYALIFLFTCIIILCFASEFFGNV